MLPHMSDHRTLNGVLIAISTISLIGLGFFSVLQNQFKDPDTASQFFKNSQSYYYIAEIIKADIRNNYPPEFQQNIVYTGIANGVLNAVVTPELVERLSIPVLKTTGFINNQPTQFVDNNLVLNTEQYKQQLLTQLPAMELPAVVADTVTRLVNSVPTEIVIIDAQSNPNSALIAIRRAGIFLDNARTLATASWVALAASLIGLIAISVRSVARLVYSLFWIFLISGALLLIMALVAPAVLTNLGYGSLDPVTGLLKNDLINGVISYVFSLARNISFIYLILAGIIYLIWRFAPLERFQAWIDTNVARSRRDVSEPEVTPRQAGKGK